MNQKQFSNSFDIKKSRGKINEWKIIINRDFSIIFDYRIQ